MTGSAQANSWNSGTEWGSAFPEKETFGAFAPEYAASAAANRIRDPKQLMEMWNRLPNDLHQWDCGTDNLSYPRRCLDMTFQGSGEHAGKAVVVHFDTISGLWHFVNLEIAKGSER
jgi:hypothetical protein